MSALPRPEPSAAPLWRDMTAASLDDVLAIEQAAYEFPWTRGNFIDSQAAGYLAALLLGADGTARGYFVAMVGADDMHVLNLTVAPAWQGRGLARVLLDSLVQRGRDCSARQLWLEVRVSNVRARAVYERYGLRQVGLRKGYYPAAGGRREDALVMSLPLCGRSAR